MLQLLSRELTRSLAIKTGNLMLSIYIKKISGMGIAYMLNSQSKILNEIQFEFYFQLVNHFKDFYLGPK